ncbi:Programmed cell death protein 6 [Mycena venus]|uniref:Programmed cell death protein 6 n=1 Tax=Mycena venus TaxID=2733690 RepID=A0A8H6Z051_9AGAR|nr:Programmed cell death protein 6 [Mycena venus]
MRWMGSKVPEHAGFQGTSAVTLDVLASVAFEYLLNIGRTIRYLCDKYSQTMTPEETILHTLFKSGISRVQDLERYISDDVERYSAHLGKKLVGVYREVTAVDVLDGEGLFKEEDEALTMGDFADTLGENYLGLRELGIAAEFGEWECSKSPATSKHPLLPPFFPFTAAKVDSQIGLPRPYYMDRFTRIAAASPPPCIPTTGLPTLPGPPGPPGTLPVVTPIPPPPPPLKMDGRILDLCRLCLCSSDLCRMHREIILKCVEIIHRKRTSDQMIQTLDL